MANPAGSSGLRATGLRPVAILKKDNYRSWAVVRMLKKIGLSIKTQALKWVMKKHYV